MATGAEIAALGWVARVLQATTGAALAERLKPKQSDAKAKKRAFDLYLYLGVLRDSSTYFVTALRAVSHGHEDAIDELQHATEQVAHALRGVTHSLNEVEPGLAIHEPDLVEAILHAHGTRGFVVEDVRQRLDEMAAGQEDVDLSDVVERAQESLLIIESATEQFRAFLAQEFSFKESF